VFFKIAIYTRIKIQMGWTEDHMGNFGFVNLTSTSEMIAANRIQATWRSFVVERDAAVERQEAKLNKLMNFADTRPTECSTTVPMCQEADGSSRDFFGRPVKFPRKRITFNGNEFAEFQNGVRLHFPSVGVDGDKKESCLFTSAMNAWTCGAFQLPIPKQSSFFEGYAKKWNESSSAEEWDDYLKTTIKLLENGTVVRLWGDRGGFKKLYPNDKPMVVKFQKHLALYRAEKRLARLEAESRKRKMNRSRLNPEAKCFTPVVIAKPVTSRDQYEVLEDIEAKFQRLLELHQPVCIAVPL
jgi:hypothetical protein